MFGLIVAGALLGMVFGAFGGNVVLTGLAGAAVGAILHLLDKTIRQNRADPEHRERKDRFSGRR